MRFSAEGGSEEDTVGRVVDRLGAEDPPIRCSWTPIGCSGGSSRWPGGSSAPSLGRPGEPLEDLVQRTLEIAWRRLPDFDTTAEAAFESWIRGIARNVVASDRRLKRELLTEDGRVEAGTPPPLGARVAPARRAGPAR